ncbi:MAG: hypothetical protein E6J90_27025 [Deltaproteobacteria bacterium]|nr:MAG: hypothetical protein E6J90_27025 [Deltaproteobacteria bacterium]
MWSTIGSYNFDAQSRFNNLEVTVEILAPPSARPSPPASSATSPTPTYDEQSWMRLPWWRKVLAWIGYRVPRIL